MKKTLVLLLCAAILLGACIGSLPATPTSVEPSPAIATEIITEQTASPSQEPPALTPEPTSTPLPAPTQEPTPAASPTSAPVTTPVTPTALVINHESIHLFALIPDEYIKAASQMGLLFRHASVGKNITDGLDCLANNFTKRPFFCDKGTPPDMVVYDQKYDRSKWVFELHQPPPGINPPWQEKLNGFIRRVDALPPGQFQVAGYKHGYVEAIPGSKIDDLFFQNIPDDQYPGIADLEALEARHPELTIVYFTMGLPRIALPDSQNFNQQMRAYTAEHGKVFFDLADIESHTPDGTPCFDSEGQGIEAVCDDYTDEEVNGHLNALGSLRMAQAFWIMMAQLAGWQP